VSGRREREQRDGNIKKTSKKWKKQKTEEGEK
jgi:hypothetical protein